MYALTTHLLQPTPAVCHLLSPWGWALRGQDGTTLHHVQLPPWARGSAWRATRTLRRALESPHASRELPGWIDLVFGALQQGEGAAAALNVFLPCT